ncbi:ATP-grasp domain-containing protein [Candidatus Microgenomates bacterium]|nr:ATP-grasp domain-containing protein [Candidatus Microgenomates bacterium]
MKITVVFNQGRTREALTDDSVQTAHAIAAALASLGHQTDLFELKDTNLPKILPDVFFNQAWGVGSDENSEDKVAEFLAATGVSYTGADATAICLTSDKAATKKLLADHNISTPRWQKVTQPDFVLKDLSFPVIVKPDGQDCSLGIDQKSIFTNPAGLTEKVATLLKEFGESVLVEEYIAGRELNVTVLGNEVLPISEITFGPSFKDKYPIVDYAAKWEVQSASYQETVGVCPAPLSPATRELVAELAKKAFTFTNCRDYARVDFRLDQNEAPYVLEVNVNPAIGPDDGATRSAKAAGLSYAKFLEKVVKLAYARRH